MADREDKVRSSFPTKEGKEDPKKYHGEGKEPAFPPFHSSQPSLVGGTYKSRYNTSKTHKPSIYSGPNLYYKEGPILWRADIMNMRGCSFGLLIRLNWP